MDGAAPLDVALRHGEVVLEVPAVVHQPLEVDRGALLRLDLELEVLDGVAGEDVEGHCLVPAHLGRLEEDLDVVVLSRPDQAQASKQHARTHTQKTKTRTKGGTRLRPGEEGGMGTRQAQQQ